MIRSVQRWWWLLLAVPLALGLWRVRLDVEVLNLLPDEVAAVQGLRLYQQHFTSGRELLITVRGPDAERTASAARQLAESLRQQTNLVASAVWQPPWEDHPEETAAFLAYLWLNQPPAVFADLTNRLAPRQLPSQLSEVRAQLATSLSPEELGRLGYDPLGFTQLPDSGTADRTLFATQQQGFASADGTFRVVFVEASRELSDYRASAAWLGEIQNEVRRRENSTDWPDAVQVRFTGGPAFMTEIAGGMERDLKRSLPGTLAIIAALFWWAHRSWRPLLWLIAMLMLVVLGTMAMGGFVFGTLNAVSLGFAAILMGLAVDYGLVLYQESRAAPHASAREVRRTIAPGIVWSAITTATAFSLLNLGGLPGLRQLGTLVALGVLLAAVLMLFAFLPATLPRPIAASPVPSRNDVTRDASRFTASPALLLTSALAALAVIALLLTPPRIDHSARPLQPKHSPAQNALDELEAELNRPEEPLWLLVSGTNESEVAARLESVRARLTQAVTNHELRGFALPTAIWPQPQRQQTNLAAAAPFARNAEAMWAAAREAGFTSHALALAQGVVRTWASLAGTTNVIWPTHASSHWLLRRAVARTDEGWLAAGAAYPGTNGLSAATLAEWNEAAPGVWFTGWPWLGDVLFQHVEDRLVWLVGAMLVLVCLCLWFAFRRWTGVVLSLAALGFSLLLLLAIMGVAGWSWNLMNLTALPLLLGAGVDYTIHIQLALRRHDGDVSALRHVTGRAIFLCAGSTMAGFGSLGLSSNAGLASLGVVCASGVACVFFTSLFLLPAWWHGVEGRSGEGHGAISKPSSLYRARLWRCGLALVRVLPGWMLDWLCLAVAEIYFRIRRERREIVVQNLLPAVEANRAEAEGKAHALFRQFALKLADLWRYESGRPIRRWSYHPGEWALFETVRARAKGVLLLTPHLGNWEIGASMLAARGVKLLVITQPEPDDGLTELRKASRARWGIETLVIGNDGFAFVELIKRLQEGAVVALLIDRPPPPSATTVELFGRPFRASVAAAELARASGCALLGVTILNAPQGYVVRILPEFQYDRRALGSRDNRLELTRQILRAFEPEIRQHLEQWYHFVPIWPDKL